MVQINQVNTNIIIKEQFRYNPERFLHELKEIMKLISCTYRISKAHECTCMHVSLMQGFPKQLEVVVNKISHCMITYFNC